MWPHLRCTESFTRPTALPKLPFTRPIFLIALALQFPMLIAGACGDSSGATPSSDTQSPSITTTPQAESRNVGAPRPSNQTPPVAPSPEQTALRPVVESQNGGASNSSELDGYNPGELIWRYDTDAKWPSITSDKDMVYVAIDEESVSGLNALSGEVVWKRELAIEVNYLRADVEDILLVYVEDDLDAVNKQTGELAWSHKMGRLNGRQSIRFVIVDDTLFYGSDHGDIVALDVQTGSELWRFQTAALIHDTPTIHDDTVFVGSRDGYLYALNASTGDRLWRVQVHDNYRTEVVDDVVYGLPASRRGGDGPETLGVYAVDPTTGEVIWTQNAGGRIGRHVMNFIVHEDSVFVGEISGDVFALNRQDGELLWSFDETGNTREEFFVLLEDEGLVTAHYWSGSSSRSAFYSIDLETGDPLWNTGSGMLVSQIESPVEGMVFMASDFTGGLVAADSATGETIWYQVAESVGSEFEVSDDVIYFGIDRKMLALDVRTGDQLWSSLTNGAISERPLVEGKIVFVHSTGGSLYALRAGRGN